MGMGESVMSDLKRCDKKEPHIGHTWVVTGFEPHWCPGFVTAGFSEFFDTPVTSISPSAQEPLIKPADEPWRRHPSAQSPVERPTYSEAIAALNAYLDRTHCVIWGGVWTITDKERRDDALGWFIDVCQAIGLIRPEQPQPPTQVVIQDQVIASVTPLHGTHERDVP